MRFLEPFLHLCWPSSCPVCGRLGVVACPGCLDSLVETSKPLCLFCFRPFPCSVHGRNVPFLVYGAAHRDMAKVLVHSLKYEGQKALGRRMGETLARKTVLPEGIDFLVPVPLHRSSERPYNQAFEIARGISGIRNWPVLNALQWNIGGKRQVEKTAKERKNLPEGALAFSGKQDDLLGKRILLVDDVTTTGTTLKRCVDAIKFSGAEVVGAVVWTRVSERE